MNYDKYVYGIGYLIRAKQKSLFGDRYILKVAKNGSYNFISNYMKLADYPFVRFLTKADANNFWSKLDSMGFDSSDYEVAKSKSGSYMELVDPKLGVYKKIARGNHKFTYLNALTNLPKYALKTMAGFYKYLATCLPENYFSIDLNTSKNNPFPLHININIEQANAPIYLSIQTFDYLDKSAPISLVNWMRANVSPDIGFNSSGTYSEQEVEEVEDYYTNFNHSLAKPYALLGKPIPVKGYPNVYIYNYISFGTLANPYFVVYPYAYIKNDDSSNKLLISSISDLYIASGYPEDIEFVRNLDSTRLTEVINQITKNFNTLMNNTQADLVKHISETIKDNSQFFSEDYIKNSLASITDFVEI